MIRMLIKKCFNVQLKDLEETVKVIKLNKQNKKAITE